MKDNIIKVLELVLALFIIFIFFKVFKIHYAIIALLVFTGLVKFAEFLFSCRNWERQSRRQ